MLSADIASNYYSEKELISTVDCVKRSKGSLQLNALTQHRGWTQIHDIGSPSLDGFVVPKDAHLKFHQRKNHHVQNQATWLTMPA